MQATWAVSVIAAAFIMATAGEAREGLPRDSPYYGSAIDSWDNQLEARRYARQEQSTAEAWPAALWGRPLNPEAQAREEECERERERERGTGQPVTSLFCRSHVQPPDERTGQVTSALPSSGADSYARPAGAGSPAASPTRWDRGWRQDPQYGWQGLRLRNAGLFRLPDFVTPYPDAAYSRPALGSRLRARFYEMDHWVARPEQYGLPEPPAQAEWIRYYEDVLLVDFRSGVVMDAVHDFFL
jgi:Ni/Co efflux regulator RcnB